MSNDQTYEVPSDEMPIRLLIEEKEFKIREEKRTKFHQELRKTFPILWRKHENDAEEAFSHEYDCYAMPTTDDGWNRLVWKTSENLSNLIEQIAAIFPTNDLPIAVQVKEKFGTLRFYCDGRWDSYPTDFTKSFHKIISDAWDESETICEDCSKPGKVRSCSPDDPNEKLTLIKCRCECCWITDSIKLAKHAHESKRTKKGDKDFYAKKMEKLSQMLSELEK